MIIRSAKAGVVRPSEITSKSNYLNRRSFMQSSLLAGASVIAGPTSAAILPEGSQAKLANVQNSAFSTMEEPNSYEDIATYNNYYEFGTGKADPHRREKDFEPRPWSIEISGHAEKTGVLDLEDIIREHVLEERIYRMRCVEAW